MKKIIGFLILVFLLFACSQGDSASSSSQAGSGQKVLRFSYWDSYQEEGLVALVDDFLSTYEDKSVQIKVEITPWEEYFTSLDVAAQGDNMPDLISLNASNPPKYVTGGKLMPLDDLFEERGINMNDFIKPAVDIHTIDGVIYSLPRDYDTIGIWYNKKLLSAIGIEVNEENRPKTWEELRQWGLDIKEGLENNGLTNVDPLYIGAGDTYTGPWNLIVQNGGEVVKEDGFSGFSMPETIEALEFMTALMSDGVLSTNPDVGWGPEAMQADQIVAAYEGTWNTGFFQGLENPEDYDLIPLPLGKTSITAMVHSNGTAIAANTRYPEVAKDFIVYLASDKAAKIIAEKVFVAPAKKGQAQPYFDANPQYKYLKEIIEGADRGKMHYRSKVTGWEPIEVEEYNKMYAGVQDAITTAKNIQERSDLLFQRANR